MIKPCAVIPVFNHPDTIGTTLQQIRQLQLPVVLVDDGSDEHCEAVLRALAEPDDNIFLKRLDSNRGKGFAVKTGLRYALSLGYSHGLQIDADGQHNCADIPRFLVAAEENPEVLIAGRPVFDESVPRLRYYCRYLTHVWVWINTLSLEIKDSMCGFRVYPLQSVCALLDTSHVGSRMDFDSEILVRWVWRGGRVLQPGTRVNYPADGISHFRGFEDNWHITKMHTRLFFGMLTRLPKLLYRRFSGNGSRREDIREY